MNTYWQIQSTIAGCPWYAEYEVQVLSNGREKYTGRSRLVPKNIPNNTTSYPASLVYPRG
jgi:hypothetical protein